MYEDREAEIAIPPRMHITGARTSIRRTMTPAKYTEVMPYKMMKMLWSVNLEKQ